MINKLLNLMLKEHINPTLCTNPILQLKLLFHLSASTCVVVTGASSGIGRHAAISLSTRGYTVYAGVRSEKDALAIDTLRIDTLNSLRIDVTKGDTIDDAVVSVQERCGDGKSLKVLVNNAGIQQISPIEPTASKDIRACFDVNVFGLVEVTQKFLPLLTKNIGASPPRIVNIGSVAGLATPVLFGSYSSSKHAVESINDAMRNEFHGAYGASVSMLQPGSIETNIEEKMKVQVNEAKDVDSEGVYSPRLSKFYKLLNFATENPATMTTTVSTTNAIVHAIESNYPKTRYLVGPDAYLMAYTLPYLPDRLKDVIFNLLY